ncbi:unnamed protein product, partial [Prorocentrum cordatum]
AISDPHSSSKTQRLLVFFWTPEGTFRTKPSERCQSLRSPDRVPPKTAPRRAQGSHGGGRGSSRGPRGPGGRSGRRPARFGAEAAAGAPPGGAAAQHRKKLAEIFYKETWWLCANPCHCGGYGFVSASAAPMCMSHEKHCCVETLCQSEPWDEGGMGVCFAISKICCFVNHSGWGGPNDGVPLFACCGEQCDRDSGLSRQGRAQPHTQTIPVIEAPRGSKRICIV